MTGTRDDTVFIGRFSVVVMFFLVWAMVIMFRMIYLMFPLATRLLGIYGVQILIAISIIAIGFLAYEFKKRDQLSYGRVEICFGISSVLALAFSTLPNEIHLPQWVSLVGSAYVIARGRNNVSEAKSNPYASQSSSFLTAIPRNILSRYKYSKLQ